MHHNATAHAPKKDALTTSKAREPITLQIRGRHAYTAPLRKKQYPQMNSWTTEFPGRPSTGHLRTATPAIYIAPNPPPKWWGKLVIEMVLRTHARPQMCAQNIHSSRTRSLQVIHWLGSLTRESNASGVPVPL